MSPAILLLTTIAVSLVGCGSTADVSADGVAEKEKEMAASRAKAGMSETRRDDQ